ncbi:MAG: YkvA family protein [Chthoniobacterales bacterium]
MAKELTGFIQSQARALSIADVDRLIVDLPALRERFGKIPAQTYPYLADQLQFLSRVLEEQVVREPDADMVGEAAFALLYFQRSTDLIPDSIPGIGLLDDSMIVRIVLGRHEHAFKSSSHAYKLSWPAPSFDVEQLLAVISPLRLSSFYRSMAPEPRLTVPD